MNYVKRGKLTLSKLHWSDIRNVCIGKPGNRKNSIDKKKLLLAVRAQDRGTCVLITRRKKLVMTATIDNSLKGLLHNANSLIRQPLYKDKSTNYWFVIRVLVHKVNKKREQNTQSKN
jgi:hypothetical protein